MNRLVASALFSFSMLGIACAEPARVSWDDAARVDDAAQDAGALDDAATAGDAWAPGDVDAAVGDASASAMDASRDASLAATDAGADAAHDAGPSPIVSGLPSVLFYNLENAAYPGSGHPDVAVHVPDGLDLSRDPGLVVFFHGWLNCVSNVMGSTPTACTAGSAAREPLELVEQLDAANVNAILVAVELRFDAESSASGDLATAGVCHDMLEELFSSDALGARLPLRVDVDDLSGIVLGAHSGGYLAMSHCLGRGGLSNVREVQIYDGFYGEASTYYAFVRDNIARFDRSRPDALRFSTVYIGSTPTATQSTAMASSAMTWFADAGLSSSLLIDSTTSTFVDAQYEKPAIFKRSELSHHGIPRYYFERLVRASAFERLR